MLNKLLAWFGDEKGQDLVEYGLITGALSLVIVLAAVAVLVPAFDTWAGNIASGIGAALP